MKIVIFSSPSRKDMLARLTEQLQGFDYSIIDDPETFGKKNFWKRMKQAYEICLSSEHDNYVIMADDVHIIDMERFVNTVYNFPYKNAIVNLINDGRTSCWGGNPMPTDIVKLDGYEFFNVDYVDGLFFGNRQTFEAIEIREVEAKWFSNPNRSSGVGHQITQSYRRIGVRMYAPKKSIVFHGDHESVMHPEERKIHPLISRL